MPGRSRSGRHRFSQPAPLPGAWSVSVKCLAAARAPQGRENPRRTGGPSPLRRAAVPRAHSTRGVVEDPNGEPRRHEAWRAPRVRRQFVCLAGPATHERSGGRRRRHSWSGRSGVGSHQRPWSREFRPTDSRTRCFWVRPRPHQGAGRIVAARGPRGHVADTAWEQTRSAWVWAVCEAALNPGRPHKERVTCQHANGQSLVARRQ